MSLATAIHDPATGHIAVPAHQLRAALILWSSGKATKEQALSAAARGGTFPPDAIPDLDTLATNYQAKTNVAAKYHYLEEVWSAVVLLQDGIITPTQFNTLCELGG